MRLLKQQPVTQQTGFSEDMVNSLLSIMSIRNGVCYTSYTTLRFSRPAVCLKTNNGEQITIALETAKAIMKEERI